MPRACPWYLSREEHSQFPSLYDWSEKYERVFFFVPSLYCIKCTPRNEFIDHAKCVGAKKYHCKDFIYSTLIDLKEK